VVDLFDEVEEQLRTDRYKSLALRAAPWVSGLLIGALLVALGVWGWQTWQQNQIHHASEDFDAAVTVLNNGDRTAAFNRLNGLAHNGPAAYRALALMEQGGLRLAETPARTSEAVALFDQAARVAPSPIEADLASLRAIYALLDTAPIADLERRITPLTAAGRPYRLQAQEALAMARLLAGRTAATKSAYQVITLNLNAPEDMTRRAQTAIALIDSGQAGALRTAIQAAATLPPPSAANTPPPNGPAQPAAPDAPTGTAQ
jgi:hypothetical protein